MAFDRMKSYYLFCILVLIILLDISSAKPPQLTVDEKNAVDKFRTSIGPGKLRMAFMESDGYLLKWLKAANFDQEKALKALDRTLEWRKRNGIDELPQENQSHLSRHYVLDFSTTRDFNGSPVTLIPFGDWDIRRKAIQGKVVTELGRRLDYMEEKCAQLAFNLTGDATSMLIVDLASFTLRKHACAGCIPFYLNWVNHHEVHYPYNYYKVAVINTPGIFTQILTLMRSLMTNSTREAFKTYGYDRSEWTKSIYETVDPKNLPYRFGGVKKSSRKISKKE